MTMKIDIFAHIIPQKVLDFLLKKGTMDPLIMDFTKATRTLTDLELRFKKSY